MAAATSELCNIEDARTPSDGVQTFPRLDMWYASPQDLSSNVRCTPNSWRRAAELIYIMWPHWWSGTSVLIVCEIALAVFYAWSYDYIANLSGDVVSSIVAKDADEFRRVAISMFIAIAVGSFANCSAIMLGDWLCMSIFRGELSRSLTDRYMRGSHCDRVLHDEPGIKDPDARITVDINNMCLKLKLLLFGSPKYAGYVATTACAMYFFDSLVIRAGWFVPLAATFTFLATWVSSYLLSIKPTRELGDLQASLSLFSHMHTHFVSHAEEIALIGGEECEANRLGRHLVQSQKLCRRVAWANFPLNFSTIFFFWSGQLLSYVIPGASWIWLGNATYSSAGTLVSVSTLLFSFLSTITTYLLLFQDLTELVASTIRVSEMVEVLDHVELAEGNPASVSTPLSPADTTREGHGVRHRHR